MAFLDWEESFELGVKDLDEHNRHLVDLLNQTFVCRGSEVNHADLETIIEKLVDYSEYHFAAEEQWMSQKGQAGQSRHLKEHGEFRRMVKGFQNDFRQGKKGLSNEVLDFLKSWLFEHVLYVDANFAKLHHSSK